MEGEANSKSAAKRSPNFSPQDCLLLAELMGEIHPDFKDLDLTFYKVDEHRFNSRITSSTKKALWRTVAEKFNSSSTLPRETTVLQKNWDNLVSKHRNLYGDHQRAMTLTGPTGGQMSILTCAVMDAVGRECASVVGAGGAAYDSTFNMLLSQQPTVVTDLDLDETVNTTNVLDFFAEPQTFIAQKASGSDVNLFQTINRPVTSTSTVQSKSVCQCCSCTDPVMKKLKKRKLELQIQFLEKQLEE